MRSAILMMAVVLGLGVTPPGHHYGWQRGRHNPHVTAPCATPNPKLPPMCYGGNPPGGQRG